MRVWIALLGASISGQMAYRGSFAMEVAGRFWITALELVALVVLFGQIDDLAAWTRWEVVYLFGVTTLALGLAELLTDGLNDMPELIRTGAFDGILVRPVSPLVQVLGRQCRLMHVGRVAQGLTAMILALALLGRPTSPSSLGMVGVSVASAATVYAAIFILEGAACIFTVQSAELFHAFTYGGVQMTQYPLPIYGPWLRHLFLWAVPIGFVTYFPSLVVLEKVDALGWPPIMPWLAPFAALAFLGLSLRGWSFAIDRYRSTGS